MKEFNMILRHISSHPLAGRHRLKAFYRFFSWQLSQSLFPRTVIYPFVGETKLAAKKGLTGITGNIYTGLHDFAEMGFLLHFLRNEDLFFDIGANAGSYSVLASGCIGCKTIAFEPAPLAFSWLQKNIVINHLEGKVIAKNIALGSEKKKEYLTTALDTVNHIVKYNENTDKANTTRVDVDQFDTIAAIEGIPALVKIDVEGFETEVMAGMKDSLKSDVLKAIIIELNGDASRYGYDEQLIHTNLIDHGFAAYQYEPYSRKIQQTDHFGLNNTIYIRDIKYVVHRVINAPKVNVFSEWI